MPSVSASTTAGSRSGRSRKWICPTGCPADDAVAEVDERLPEAGLRREQIVVDLGRAPDHRRRVARLHLAGEHADVAEHVREAALRDPVRRGGDVPAAAELGRDDELALPLGLADEQARAGDVDVDEVVVRSPREHRVDHRAALRGIVDPVHLRPGRAEAAAPAAVHVDDDVGAREEHPA